MLVWIVLGFVNESVTRTAAAGALRITALDHEVLNDAMELRPVVELILRQKDEVVDGDRGFLRIKLANDRATTGVESCRVALVWINYSCRWRRVLLSHVKTRSS